MMPSKLLRRWFVAVLFLPAVLLGNPAVLVKDMATGNVLLSEERPALSGFADQGNDVVPAV
jgi:hypothetical protein